VSRWVSARVGEIAGLGVRALEVEAHSGDESDVLVTDGRADGEALYVVLTGRAAFTIDGDEVDAAARTLVYVRDPGVRRGAVATAPATTILAATGLGESRKKDHQ
jgi:hypothetical protein